jgi:hypothetical protein
MLMAYGICFVLAQSTVSAQEKESEYVLPKNVRSTYVRPKYIKPGEGLTSFYDTLIINLQGNDKILFIGNDLKKMVRYQRADSLKMLFLNDFEKAISENSLTREVQRVHYFVHSSGKRRLKAETPEYSDNKVDADYEIKRLNLDLPKYQYVIHDLSSDYELQIYINDPEQTKNILDSINLDDVIHYKGINKLDIRNSYKIEINTDHNNYKIGGKAGSYLEQIEITTSFGIGVFGNVIAPLIGGDIGFMNNDKYSIGKYQWVFGYTAFPVVNMNAGKITGVSLVSSYDLKFLINLFRKNHKIYYFGLEAGVMKSNELSPFNNAYKFGIVSKESTRGVFSFDLIKDKNRNSIYAFTWKIRF